ncbi:nuclear transport factor 2 family protein [Flavobacterium sp. '19STA2R22 D10 B1']|uniref:nuclear transport factor 2 family protein n=1 Tax=Flavobacterium aerium TaxID=3037261 RepID=UPI00278BCA46|nr:nuclear transport factor 2 family protein [Flavobacterium sp. '19STA2R22 D10 B1']
MNANETLITAFYTAFSNKDAAGMIRCYHNEVTFEDPAFGSLNAKDVKDMWTMLLSNNQNIKVTFSAVKADETKGSAHWDAYYVFSKTNRNVHNSIDAKFEFKDGLIYKHIDSFSLWNWSKQALGLTGYLLGWSSIVRNSVRKQTRALLDKYQTKTQ